jgi:hypothetical protein
LIRWGAIQKEEVMNKTLSTLTAATAGVGVMVGVPTAAHAFVPVVLGAIIAGSVLGGAALGTAAYNSSTVGVARSPVAVAPAPAVTVGSATCYFTTAPVNGVWQRVQVCNNY